MSEINIYNRRKPKRSIEIIISYILEEGSDKGRFISDIISFFEKEELEHKDYLTNNVILLKVEIVGVFREFITTFYDEFLKNKEGYKIKRLIISKLSGYVFINETGEKLFSIDA